MEWEERVGENQVGVGGGGGVQASTLDNIHTLLTLILLLRCFLPFPAKVTSKAKVKFWVWGRPHTYMETCGGGGWAGLKKREEKTEKK